MKKTKKNKLILIPVFLSSILLITSAYAWFTYFSDVDSTLTGHVIGWNIDFDGSSNIQNEYEIVINNIYPGMDDYSNEFNINNTGESAALITSDIKYIKIFNTTYNLGDTIDGVELTNENFLSFINRIYSFKFNMNISKDIIRTGETSVFTFSLIWPYETYQKVENDDVFNNEYDYYKLIDGEYIKTNVTSSNFVSQKNDLYYINDVNDTFWGASAYEYKIDNPTSPCIEIKFMINATQYIE